ncbi:hypothetical protein QBC47DRAFT_465517 [Echria macrotheca]|uniref:Nephrocystin 3-like N-terminal domain-containing protein n=1 Tax=Echria macrotheca TaxID=438768 RepID=A0AAJ0B383_9PEZI|nr:hypothetical protein QBC47DRAFT_465517 [Echria macrotheca]
MKFILGTSTLRDHLVKWAGEKPLVIVRYYAWNAGTTPQKTLRGLQQSLVYQVLEEYPDLLPVLAPTRWTQFWLFLSEWIKSQAPEELEVAVCFENLMAISGAKLSLAIFVDGLDELDVPPRESSFGHVVSLYDFIWKRIPERTRKRGAILIQAVEVTQFALDWRYVWLLDEYAQHD